MDDPVKDSVVIRIGKLGFFFPTVVFEELRISYSIDVDMPGGTRGSLLIAGVVSGGIGSVGEVELPGLVYRSVNG